ncbi:sensor histidine kinase [Kitasatospora sp. NPDC051984]|uniref:sensor histidine kinase n=1 Tax=Kitasatospora sp. NPDC051984 TaxID=3364059 RepID=UPI0037CA3A7B
MSADRRRWRRWWPALGVRARAALAALVASALAFVVAAPLVGDAVHALLYREAELNAIYAMTDIRVWIRGGDGDSILSGQPFAVLTEEGEWLNGNYLSDRRQEDPALGLTPLRLAQPADGVDRPAVPVQPVEATSIRYPAGISPYYRLASPEPRIYHFLRVLTEPVSSARLALLVPPGRRPAPEMREQRLTVYVMIDPTIADETTAVVTDHLLALVAPVASLFVALIAWLATGLALRPVESIRRQMAAVRGGAFHERVPVPRARDGIHRLARTTNDTLDRLQHALDEQRRLVADASHELRSPLAALRSSLEVPLAHPTAADWPTVVRGALTDTERLQDLADDLLLLARAERDTDHSGDTVDLHDMIAEQLAERRYSGRELTYESELDEAVLPGREMLPARLVRNLLDNAARHAHGRVAVRLTVAGGWAHLTVEDDGPGIPAADRERVFERFVRLDDARDRHSGGAGLGLALVRTIAHSLGGTVAAKPPSRLPGARLVVRLPVASGNGIGPPTVPGGAGPTA